MGCINKDGSIADSPFRSLKHTSRSAYLNPACPSTYLRAADPVNRTPMLFP